MKFLNIPLFFLACFPCLSIAQGLNVEFKHACAHSQAQSFFDGRVRTTADDDLMKYDVNFYWLEIQASADTAYIQAKVTMHATVVVEMDQVVLELSDSLVAHSLTINDEEVAFTHNDNLVTATLTNPLPPDGFLKTVITYEGDGSTTGFFAGISNALAPDWNQKVTWTLSEPYSAKDWFACKQVLEDKADSAWIYITVPDSLMAGSNGLLQNISSASEGKLTYEWKTRYPIAYYLISMTVSAYTEYTTYANVEGKAIPIQNYVYPNALEFFENELNQVGPLIEIFSNLYTAYPFADEKYGHCMAPMGGAMEHQTMSTMNHFDLGINAHELGHQWFGDNVTCANWQDIWVNEGFARYSEYLAFENIYGKASANDWMSQEYTRVLSGPAGSVYIPFESVSNPSRIFNFRLTYSKGAALVHMIRNIIDDDEVFFNVLRSYQTKFKDSVATGEDFKEVLEEVSGQQFDDFFNEWYYAEGHPIYDVRWNLDSDTLYLQLKQHASTGSTIFHNPVEFNLQSGEQSQHVRVVPASADQLFKIPRTEPITAISIDPENWLLKQVRSFAKDKNLKAPKPPLITDVEQQVAKQFSIYPNPTKERLFIKHSLENEPSAIEIFSVQGYKILDLDYRLMHEVDMQTFTAGLYFVRITTNSGSFIKKVRKD